MKLSSAILLSCLAARAAAKNVRGGTRPARHMCADKILTFDQFEAGDFVTNELLRSYGHELDITVESDSTECNVVAPVLFDTHNPTCNDHDLGSTEPLDRKAVIIHEDSSGCQPDDCARGGRLIFTWDHPVRVENLRILDMDEPVHLFVQTVGSGLYAQLADPPTPGDGQHVTVAVNMNEVVSLKVAFEGSGGIPYISYTDCPGNPSGSGDPHFATWSKQMFDYHGQCDLQLIESNNFANGLGLDVQVRTTQQSWYSYIDTAAVRIGKDVLEVGTHGIQYLNGNDKIDFKNEVAPPTLAGYPITFDKYRRGKGGKERVYQIQLGEHEYIHIRAYKDFLFVSLAPGVYMDLQDSVGLMGDWAEGKMLARDGKTLLEDDPDRFGQEWQVQKESLFQNARAPQFPMECVAAPPVDVNRKLKESIVSRAEAEQACSTWAGKHRESCIFDVMVTGDIDYAL